MSKITNKTKIQIASLLGAILVTIGSTFSITQLYLRKQSVKAQKSYHQVVEDCDSFNADAGLVYKFRGNRYLRLKFTEDKPVIIKCEKEKMDDREYMLIEKVVDYYNKIFKTINENYCFELNEKKKLIQLLLQ